jgi:hypothetical protein
MNSGPGSLTTGDECGHRKFSAHPISAIVSGRPFVQSTQLVLSLARSDIEYSIIGKILSRMLFSLEEK